jgi:hypothetical protein
MLYKSQNIRSDILLALSLITTDVKYGTKLKFNDKAEACQDIFAKIISIIFDKISLQLISIQIIQLFKFLLKAVLIK